MRKMKKINGYLVVKFNARELREYEGTALGEYGVIDAELYTGNLDVDRGAMESFAAAIEDAVKARTAPAERTTFEHLHPDLKRHRETAKIYALGLALAEKCPPNDCRVYLNIFNAARELDAALDSLDADGAPALALRKALRERVGELAEMMEDNYAVEQYRKGGGAK